VTGPSAQALECIERIRDDLDREHTDQEIAAVFAICHGPAPDAPQQKLDLKPSA
jgi:hypothetical protein